MAEAADAMAVARKYGPGVVAAAGLVTAFLRDHPDLSIRARERMQGLGTRLAEVQRRRGAAARIRGKLDVIRETAADPGQSEGAPEWLARAHRIELGVRLAESQGRWERRATFARLGEETDGLLAHVLERVTDDAARSSS